VHDQDTPIVNLEGIFCVFEGIDGSGKTTLIQGVRQRLNEIVSGTTRRVIVLKEPTDGATGILIRKHLSNQTPLERREWLELFLKDRRENIDTAVLPHRNSGAIILQDRYFYSTAAYQGEDSPDGPFSPEAIIEKNLALGFPEPDLLFFLEIPPALAYKRVDSRSEKIREAFETYHEQEMIHNRFKRILPDFAILLDATRPPGTLVQTVTEKIMEAIGTDR